MTARSTHEQASLCPSCKGTGGAMLEWPRTPCPHCTGKGRVSASRAEEIRQEFADETGLTVDELRVNGWIV